jgi:hypothetical protein
MLPIMEVKRPFSDKHWLDTPEPVKAYIIHLEQLIGQMLKKQDELEKRIEKIASIQRRCRILDVLDILQVGFQIFKIGFDRFIIATCAFPRDV